MEHPAAVVRRQQEQDVARLAPSIRQLTERQSQLFFLMHSAIARYKPGGFGRLADADVADAAAALAATLETSARGVIYDHAAAGPLAQSLVLELKRLLDEVRGNGARVFDHEVIVVLRAIELGARPTHGEEDSGGRTYLDLIARLLHGGPRSEESRPAAPEGRLIVP